MPEVRVLEQFAPEVVERIRGLANDVERSTGTPPLGETTWLGLGRRRAADDSDRIDIGLIATNDSASGAGAFDAYAHLARHHGEEWSLETAIRPGTPDVRADLLVAALAEAAVRGGGHVTMWAHSPTDDDTALAEKVGLTPERELLQLRVPLPLAETARWPDGITVRSFVPGTDDDAWILVNNRAFAGHPEQGNWTIDVLRGREAEPWFDPAGFLLAFAAAGEGSGDASTALAGFCWTKVHPASPPEEPDALGEIYVIGVDPSHQGTGLGRALVVGGLESLAARGLTTGMLFVDAANTAAVALYTALGFTTHRLDRAYGTKVTAAT